MSNSLINERPLVLLPSLAVAVGVSKAIVLQQVQYWVTNPKAGVWKDGFKWVHNTYAEWQENFPFWSEANVRKIINQLEDEGLLISAQIAPNPHDRTKSYTIDYTKLEEVVASHVLPEYQMDESPEYQMIHRLLPETTNTGDGLASLPVEWQVAAGVKNITVHDEKEAQMKDSANLIAQGTGALQNAVFLLAYTFMTTRGIIIPLQDAKGNRKVAKAMVNQGVLPHHVESAVKYMIQKNLTCVDLFSVQKIATNEANPAPESYDGAIEGV
ncbi:MAG TPA: hypothetical protein VIY48_18700 [Candidatus Paceibacterota bacterium]